MKLSNNTITILKNFANINKSIFIRTGETISTINQTGTILAKVDVEESFQKEFALYDLSRFLGVCSLFVDPSLKFKDDHVIISDGSAKATYVYASPTMVVCPPTESLDIQDDIVFSFTLTKENLVKIQKAISTLQVQDITITADGTDIRIGVSDVKNPTSDTFNIKVGECDKDVKLRIKQENLVIIPDDYQVSVSSKDVLWFQSANIKTLEYWVVVEDN